MLGFSTSLIMGQDEPAYVDISPCMAMENDENRYACYDLLEQQVRSSREAALPVVSLRRNPQPAIVEQSEEVPEPESGSLDDFGKVTLSEAGRQSNSRILETADGGQELLDTVTSLRQRIPNQWEITLASGQIWHQVNSKRFRLREGMEVRIYPSPLGGSFRLEASNMNGFIQVRRIQ